MSTTEGGMSSIKLKNVDHIALNIIDLDVTAKFYSDVLGFKADREIPPKGKRRHIEMEAGNICLAMFEVPELDMKSAHEIMTHQGYLHMAFEVELVQFDSVVESLRAHKVNLDGEPRNHGGGPSVYFFDPNGYQIELHANT
jgi:catechol 2,3-dioxygenase-like lactoylglutathione lyase family enzyme